MGFSVVHMQKIKAGGVRGIQSHNNREHTPRTNPDVDPLRSAQNVHLLHCQNYSRTIKAPIETHATETKTVRKDAVVMCGFIVTSDEQTMKDMTPFQQHSFFKDSLEWFSSRYGAENIVNATVHMDETTPHMHIWVIPIHDSRLAAKTLFDRKELVAIQTDFASQVGKRYGLERGQEGSTRSHLSEQRFKLEATKKELSAANETLQKAQSISEQVEGLQKTKTGLERQIEALEANLSEQLLSIQEIDRISPQRTVTGNIRGVTVEDIEQLKDAAKSKVVLRHRCDKLEAEKAQLQQQVPSMAKRIQDARELSELKEENRRFHTKWARVPEDVREQMEREQVQSWGAQESDWDLDR